jgi:glycosyltransferase involved in cell wall biosynthesis
MKILFVTLFLPPFRYSGTEVYTLNLAKRFLSLGHDVEILCAEDWENGSSYWNGVSSDTLEGILVHRIHLNWKKAINPNRVLYHSYSVQIYLNKLLTQNHYDIVHITSVVTLGIGVFKSVHQHGVPLVLTLTDFWFICPNLHLLRANSDLCDGNVSSFTCEDCLLQSSALYKRITQKYQFANNPFLWDSLSHMPILSGRRGFRGMLLDVKQRRKRLSKALEFADIILAPSSFLQWIFKQHNINTKLSLYGHDLAWRENYSGKTHSEKIRFGYIGQIQNIKGVHILLEAFQLAQLNGKATLQVFGDLNQYPDYSKELSNIAKDNSSISLSGRYLHEQLAQVLSNIDILVVPSIWYENNPLVIQEAFAVQTPVIASNVGGMADAVIDDFNGLLFERNNVADLAKQMLRVVEEPGLLKKLIQGIQPVRRIEEEVNELEALYSDLIKNEHSPVANPTPEITNL